MIEFKQKLYAEHDAMRSLYVELMKDWNWRNRVGIIDSSALIPILKGNNIVIERFVISDSFFHPDKYRMYIKVGARAKMPDSVRLPGMTYKETLGRTSLKFNAGFNHPKQNEFSETYNGIIAQKDFSKGKNNNGNNGGGGGGKFVSAEFQPNTVELSHEVTECLGETLELNQKDRSLVLEFKDIEKAVRSLDILPFGLNYKVYLLDL